MERSLWMMALKAFVNSIFGGELHQRNVSISFLDKDLEMVKLPLVDPLVIKLQIRNAMVSKSESDAFDGGMPMVYMELTPLGDVRV